MKNKKSRTDAFRLAAAGMPQPAAAAADGLPTASRPPAGPASIAAAPELTYGGADASLPLDLLRHARSQWKIVAISVASLALLAWLIAALQPRRYQASAVAAVVPVVEALPPEDLIRGVDTLERRTLVGTVAALVPRLKGAATGAGAAPDDYLLEAVVLPNTNLVRVDVEGPDRNRVAAAANRVPGLLSAQTRAMYGVYRVTTVAAAVPPPAAVYPRVGRSVLAGAIAGALLGILLAWAAATRRLRGVP